jgi:molecular chaperone GrpE
VQKDSEQEVDDVTKKKASRGEDQRVASRGAGPGTAAGRGPNGAAPDEVEVAEQTSAPVSEEAAGAARATAAEANGPAAAEPPAQADTADDQEAGDGVQDGPTAAEQDGPTAAEQSQAIEADLAGVRAEAVGYLNDLRRLQAEFDNYRKRMLREQTVRVASASQALVSKLLPVLDNFELAISHAEQSQDFDRGMLKGIEMAVGALQAVLRGEGLSRIEAEGKPFDPERHEAVIAVEEEGAEPGTVVDVVRTGYELQGKVLRPAMVKVAR